MFSGKTDELIRRLRRATIARQKVQVSSRPSTTVIAEQKVTSHAGSEYAAIPVRQRQRDPGAPGADTTVVAIDEAQFFDDEIIPISQGLADRACG